VPSGSVTVLLGPNGAGKTTAVRAITGALKLDAGTVKVFGRDPASDGEHVRSNTGVVYAKPAFYERLTGRENLAFASDLYQLGPLAPIDASAARFGILESLDLPVGGYSTGMKARLALARAVLHSPDLMLLDEPTAGLDPESSRAVLALIKEMAAAGRTVVMCTHLLLEAEGLADQIVIMDRGSALVSGTAERLADRYWPPMVILDAENRADLIQVSQHEGVSKVSHNGYAIVHVDRLERVPDIVLWLTAAGVRLTRVEPMRPTLEDLYFAIRKAGP
jgi:ABC-2 type transport system ATP-binding protein